jgi:adenylyl- and sulfurtransferase ThiI
MSLVHQIGDSIRERIIKYTGSLFQQLGVTLEKDKLWHDLAQLNPDGIKATFYVTGLDNVKRKEFNALVEELKKNIPQIQTFKVKFKRPDKEVRFYLEARE